MADPLAPFRRFDHPENALDEVFCVALFPGLTTPAEPRPGRPRGGRAVNRHRTRAPSGASTKET
ncbi:hypothetical protein AB0L25_13165 [Spirillospora sp. NPDC052242]